MLRGYMYSLELFSIIQLFFFYKIRYLLPTLETLNSKRANYITLKVYDTVSCVSVRT